MFTIAKHPSLETARKNICCDTGLPYTGGPDEITEWQMAYALHSFEIGQTISEDELRIALGNAIAQQHLDDFVERGLMLAIWDEKQGAIIYKANPNIT